MPEIGYLFFSFLPSTTSEMVHVTQVSKPVPIVSEFARLCNAVHEGSFNAASRKVDFAALNQIQVHPIALFGYNDDVWDTLVAAGTVTIHLP